MAKKKKNPSAAQLTARERAKRPNLKRIYGRNLADITPGQFSFRLRLVRPGGRTLDLDNAVQSFTWVDEEATLAGSLSIKRNDPVLATMGVGHRVRCEVRVGSKWNTLWEMAVQEPEWDLGPMTGDFELADDMAPLTHAKRDWSFRKTKKRGKGWYCHEIAREAAKREGLKIRKLAKGTKRINKLTKKKATALDVIREAYHQEREHSKQRFIIRLVDGEVEIVALDRNAVVYEFRDQVTDAQVSAKRSRRPSTVIRGRGRIGKGSKAKKVKYTAQSVAASRRFGRTVKEKDYGRVDSEAELKFKTKRSLANALRVTRTGSIQVPGVPFIRRGDALRWITDEPGWHGATSTVRDRSFVFATRVTHTVGASGYTTDLDVVQDDPYVRANKDRDKEMRDAARARRKKKK